MTVAAVVATIRAGLYLCLRDDGASMEWRTADLRFLRGLTRADIAVVRAGLQARQLAVRGDRVVVPEGLP